MSPLGKYLWLYLHKNLIKLFEKDGKQASRPQNESYYFLKGVAFPKIGDTFSARSYKYKGVFGDAGSSVFLKDVLQATCVMTSELGRTVLSNLNPTVNFQFYIIEHITSK